MIANSAITFKILYFFHGCDIILDKSLHFVYPSGKPMTPHLLCCQGLAVVYYGFALDALDLGHPRLSHNQCKWLYFAPIFIAWTGEGQQITPVFERQRHENYQYPTDNGRSAQKQKYRVCAQLDRSGAGKRSFSAPGNMALRIFFL